MNQLKSFIQSKVKISDEILSEILNHFESKSLKKGKFLIKQGQHMTNYYFVNSGGVRVYLNHGDKEFTAWLSFENNFIVDIASINSKKPSIYNIEAIEDTQLLSISFSNMDRLYEKHNEWQAFGRKLWENAFLEVVDGMIKHQTLSAEERYLKLMEQSEMLQRVPLKQLSTFLGMTPTSLSRIRKKMME